MMDAFIQRWETSGAAERANYQLFLSELGVVLESKQGANDGAAKAGHGVRGTESWDQATARAKNQTEPRPCSASSTR